MIRNDVVYLGDNGRALCGDHLGVTAKATGRDLSGQPIMPVIGPVLDEAKASGYVPTCEHCGLRADDHEAYARSVAGALTRPLSDIFVPAPTRKVRGRVR